MAQQTPKFAQGGNKLAGASADTKNKQYLIRSAMLFNMVPMFNDKTDTLILASLVPSETSKKYETVIVSINGGLMPKALAHRGKHDMHRVYNAYASKFMHDEHGYDGISLYNIPDRYNIDEPVGDMTDPEAYVRDMLTVMKQSGDSREAEVAAEYTDRMFANFKKVIGQIEGSNWPDRETISQNLYNYCRQLQNSMLGQKAEAGHSAQTRGE